MRKIINKITYWAQVLLLPVYWLSFLFPRNKRIWLFGSTFGRRFADNPRYFFLYVSQHKEELGIRPVWISHDKKLTAFLRENGYEAYYYHSIQGIWYALRGKVYLFDNYSKDINFWQSGRALKVNMWHGIPLKKIQADNRFDAFRHPQNMWERFCCFPRRLSDEKPSHYVLTTSAFLKPIFSSAFRTEHVLLSGYPRNDRLITDGFENLLPDSEKKEQKKILEFLQQGDSRKMVYYMPTFRESEKKFFEVMNLQSFQTFLQRNDILFCAKLHPKSKLNAEFAAIQGDNILVIDKDADPYTFLELADVLVTDYSSIYFDYLLTGKPVVFFDYDLQEYLSDTREMYFDYQDFTPGRKAQNQEEFEKAIEVSCKAENAMETEYADQYKRIRDCVFDVTDRMASPGMVEDIKEIIGL